MDSDITKVVLRRPFSAGSLGTAVTTTMGLEQSRGGSSLGKPPEALRIYYSKMTYVCLKYTTYNMY